MTLEAFSNTAVLSFFLVFARMGSALLFMPGFGEIQIPVRARLAFAIVLSIALIPIAPLPQSMPSASPEILFLIGIEVTIGLWIGLSTRVLLSAMQFAGYQVGQISGLANAFGPSLGTFEGATLVATFLLLGAVALIFATDTHHLILVALIESYTIFPLGFVILEDLSEQIVRVGARSLYIGTSIAAPFFVIGVILNLGMGLANRMMPQLPIFFVAGSVLIGVGFIVLYAALPSVMEYLIQSLSDWLTSFTV